MKQVLTQKQTPKPRDKERIVTFGVRTIYGISGIEYLPVTVTIDGDQAIIEKLDVKRPYIQHAYAKAGDALIEYGITQAGKVRRPCP